MFEERVEDLQDGRADGAPGGDEHHFGDDVDDFGFDARIAASVTVQMSDQFSDHHVTKDGENSRKESYYKVR